MKHIAIFYFSGTGNTAHVVSLLKKALQKKVPTVDLIKIEDLSTPLDASVLKDVDCVGLSFPIHAFSSPAIVSRFVAQLPVQVDMPMFHVKTAGGLSALNDCASTQLIKKLSKKGYITTYDRTVAMGSNWMVGYDDRMVKQLAVVAEEKVAHIASDITSGVERIVTPKPHLVPISRLVAFGEHRFGAGQFGKSLRADDTCNLCMICVNNCPQKNIQKVDGKLVFGKDCLWCMRCIYSCPKQSISSSIMQFSIVKEGYNLAKTLSNASIKPDFLDANTDEKFKGFYDYISDKNA